MNEYTRVDNNLKFLWYLGARGSTQLDEKVTNVVCNPLKTTQVVQVWLKVRYVKMPNDIQSSPFPPCYDKL